MSDRYRVRVMVLAIVNAEDDIDAKDEARLIVQGAGLEVLHTEEPELVPPMSRYGSVEGDIYP